MNWTLKQIAQETDQPLHTVKRLFYSSRTVYEQFITRGKRNKVLLDKGGRTLLKRTIREQYENSSETAMDNSTARPVREQVNNSS